jgi:tungstate transport system ATP-binding protein
MLQYNFNLEVRETDTLLPLRARNISLSRSGRTLLRVVDFDLPIDGTTVILGHNGAGKTLLLKVLAGIEQPDTGTVTWAGSAPDRRRALKLGYVLQRPVLLRRSVLANVQYPLAIAGFDSREQQSRAMSELRRWKLDHLATIPARVLSGGEQRRVAIARALVARPQCLFLDEPAANLDPQSTAAIEDMIESSKLEGIPVLLITHDLRQARRLGDIVVFMSEGHMSERTPADLFFKTPKSAEAREFVSGGLGMTGSG